MQKDSNTVTITFKRGAKKPASVEADSITSTIKDIMKVVESKEIKTEYLD